MNVISWEWKGNFNDSFVIPGPLVRVHYL